MSNNTILTIQLIPKRGFDITMAFEAEAERIDELTAQVHVDSTGFDTEDYAEAIFDVMSDIHLSCNDIVDVNDMWGEIALQVEEAMLASISKTYEDSGNYCGECHVENIYFEAIFKVNAKGGC